MDLDKLSLDQLFPPIPFCKDVLEDFHIRTKRFPFYLRKRICTVLNWKVAKYERLVRMAKNTGFDELSGISAYQRHVIIDETLKALEGFTAYIRANYISD